MPPWFRNDFEQDPKQGGRVLYAILFSLAIHLLFVVAKVPAPEGFLMNEEPKEPIEVVQAPPETPPQRAQRPKTQPKTREQRMAETEKENEKVDPNARFLSDRNQAVEKQMKAQAIDDFRAKQGTGSRSLTPDQNSYIPPTGEETKEAGKKAPEAENLAEGDGDVPKVGEAAKPQGVKRDWKTLSLKDLSVGGDGGALAATDDKLDDVATGERTILSTREFRYFSYYYRIKELLRQYWKPKVEQKLYSLWAKGRNVGADELVTKVMVMLDGRGTIQKITRITSSGVSELDDAAIEAFERAAPFPNPPKGIIDNDGYVRIRWDFILKTEAAPRIQFATPGQRPTQ